MYKKTTLTGENPSWTWNNYFPNILGTLPFLF